MSRAERARKELEVMRESGDSSRSHWKGTLNSVIRYLLSPFVVVGWVLARFGMWTTFGIATAGMAILAVLLLGLIGLLMFSGITNFRVFPGIIQAPVALVVAILMIVGVVRGALYGLDKTSFDTTMHSHFVDPINLKNILAGFAVLCVVGFSLFLFLKLITGR